jgi:hypothetical protein
VPAFSASIKGKPVQAKGIQYSVRGIPPEVDRALRHKAAKRRVSLNQLLVEELTHATVGTAARADFSHFVGKWEPDPAFDEILRSQRKINTNHWR